MFGFVNISASVTIILFSLVAGLVLRALLFSHLGNLAKKSKTEIDDAFISSIKDPFIIWCLMLGIYFALIVSQTNSEIVRISGKILLVLAIISVSLVLENLAKRLITVYSGKLESVLPVTSLTSNISKVVIYGTASLIILGVFGISITPILATLGVGGLAVALALQETLSNLFAGFHIIASRQIKVGDYIKLESGEEGYITDINWRNTKIRMLSNNIVLIANSKLTQIVITNYYMPDKEMAVLINLGVHYDSDLKKAEQITVEVGKEVMQNIPGGVKEFTPFIRYHTFNDFSIDFTVILRAKEFVDQYIIKHEFIKRLHERYKKEGIVIPYPIRVIKQQ